MKQISNKEYAEYVSMKKAKRDGRILMPETLRFICEANKNDPAKIGEYFLGLLPGVLSKTAEHHLDHLTPKEKKQYLFEERKNALDLSLELGAISQEEYDAQLQELTCTSSEL